MDDAAESDSSSELSSSKLPRKSNFLSHYPVSRLMLGGLAVNYTLNTIFSDVHQASNLIPSLGAARIGDICRLLALQSVYRTNQELIAGGFLLYRLRATEQFMGSEQFATFLTVSYVATTTLLPVVSTILRLVSGAHDHALVFATSGLTPLLFAVMINHRQLLPSSDWSQYQGSSTTSVSGSASAPDLWLYGTPAYLAFCDTPQSLVAATIGCIVGTLYHRGYLLPKSWRLPRYVTKIFASGPTCTTRRPGRNTTNGTSSGHSAEFRPDSGVLSSTVRSSRAPRPSPADIQTIVTMMGVSQEVATQALVVANNSLERAIDNLLAG